MLYQGFPENSLLLWNQEKTNLLQRVMSFKTNIAIAFTITSENIYFSSLMTHLLSIIVMFWYEIMLVKFMIPLGQDGV